MKEQLYMAAKNGHEADVDAKESNRRTPLYVASGSAAARVKRFNTMHIPTLHPTHQLVGSSLI
jgi:hypothetical protein